ncbi:Na_H_Exchanger domain-containing protein, partial [Haematococcus lacustris]
MTWRMSIKAKREGAMTKFWDVLSFSMNGVIFFYVGASSANFLIRLGQDVRDQGADGSWDLCDCVCDFWLVWRCVHDMAHEHQGQAGGRHDEVLGRAVVQYEWLGQDVRDQGADGSWDLFWALGLTLPLIYLSFSLLRGVLLLAAVTGARWMGIGIHISWQGVVFATVGGMRGAVSLVLAQSVLTLNAQPAAQQGSPPGNYAGVLGVAGDTEPKV